MRDGRHRTCTQVTDSIQPGGGPEPSIRFNFASSGRSRWDRSMITSHSAFPCIEHFGRLASTGGHLSVFHLEGTGQSFLDVIGVGRVASHDESSTGSLSRSCHSNGIV